MAPQLPLLGQRDGVAVIGPDGAIRMATPALARLLQVPAPGELVGCSWLSFVVDKDRVWAQNTMTEARRAPQRTEYRLARRDGGRFLASLYLAALRDEHDEPVALFVVAQSATHARRREESLHRFEQIASASSDHISFVDREHIYRAVNDAYLQAFDKPRDEIVGHSVAQLHGEGAYSEIIKPHLDRCVLEGVEIHYEATFEFPNRSAVPMEVTYRPCRDELGNITGIAVVARDIRAHRQAQGELRLSERRYRHLVERAPFGVLVTNRSGKIVSVNAKCCELLGRQADELIGARARDAFVGASSDAASSRGAAVAKTVFDDEQEVELANGRVLQLSTVKLDPVTGTRLTTMADITRSRALERGLSEAQRLEALGTLAGGVAHEMNNVLAVVLGLASAAEVDLPGDHPARGDLTEIMAAARRGRSLTQNLLGFARKGSHGRERASPRQVIEAVDRILRRTMPKNVELVVRTPERLPDVVCDKGQMIQAFLNLCINSLDALPGGGRLAVTASMAELGEQDRARFPDLAPGRYLSVTVEDDGQGMTPETLRRAFEPFFTTKPPGEGTGLGLSMVYGVVKRHGGAIGVESELGGGTRATVLLPAADEQTKAEAAVDDEPPPLSRPGCTVLVVDDEAMVRSMAKRLLRRLGCHVLVAEGGAQALEIFEAQRQSIDVVLLDVAMPGMNGVECCNQLMRLDPAARVVFCTGHADDPSYDLASSAALGTLRKPFDLAALREQLSAIVSR